MKPPKPQKPAPASFTPGPWTMEDAHKNGPMGNDVRYIRGADMFYPALALSNSGDHGELMTANALLISSAPDLLAALHSLLPIACFGADYLEQRANEDGGKGEQENYQIALQKIRDAQAAILKAEGRKS